MEWVDILYIREPISLKTTTVLQALTSSLRATVVLNPVFITHQ